MVAEHLAAAAKALETKAEEETLAVVMASALMEVAGGAVRMVAEIPAVVAKAMEARAVAVKVVSTARAIMEVAAVEIREAEEMAAASVAMATVAAAMVEEAS